MNKVQENIVEILKYSIHNKKIELNKKENVLWHEVFEECKKHNIEALVYYGIHLNTLKNIDRDIIERWKKQTFMSNVYQINHINQISNILSILKDKDIPVIVLKGLVIRDLYPKSELRTMGDADILVHKKDIDKVINILNNLGYEEEDRHDPHIEFMKNNSKIEVHWSLTNEGMFNGMDEFNHEIWLNSIEVKIGDSAALSMCNEDLLLYLCIHMAKHFKYSGFGIRQLCDVLCLVEKCGNSINWDSFMKKAKRSGIDKFSICIFSICNKLFEMSIPDELEYFYIEEDEYLDLIINNIFYNGVHGKKDKVESRVKMLSNNNDICKTNFLISFKNIYFPHSEKLGKRYEYAKKNKAFLPIAWIHRIINTIFRTDYSLSDKINLSIKSTGISKKHSELLNWLEL